MTLLKKYYGVAILLFCIVCYLGFQLYQIKQFQNYSKAPKPNDIYIFAFEEIYSPYLLDQVDKDSSFFFAHPYEFRNAMPSLNEIWADSFNDNIHYIYGRSEINRLIEEEKIIKIYR